MHLKYHGLTLNELCNESQDTIAITEPEKNIIFGENNSYQYKFASIAALLNSDNGLTKGLGGVKEDRYCSGGARLGLMFFASSASLRPVVSFTQDAPIAK